MAAAMDFAEPEHVNLLRQSLRRFVAAEMPRAAARKWYPRRIALLDNFSWPSCHDPQRLGGLVRAAEACYDGALAYRTPFISGKDSLNNQFTAADGTTFEIPATLLISGLGIVPDVGRCLTMDAKAAGNVVSFLLPGMFKAQ